MQKPCHQTSCTWCRIITWCQTVEFQKWEYIKKKLHTSLEERLIGSKRKQCKIWIGIVVIYQWFTLPQIKNYFGVTGDRCLDNVQNAFGSGKTNSILKRGLAEPTMLKWMLSSFEVNMKAQQCSFITQCLRKKIQGFGEKAMRN